MPVWVDPDAPTVKTSGTITVAAPVPAITNQPPSTAIRLLFQSAAAVTTASIDRGAYRGPAALVISNVGTGSPTELVDIQGSVDNVNFYNLAYALVATPNTIAVAQITITTSATTTYLLVTDQAWRYLRVVIGSVTTNTTTILYYQ